MSSLRAGVRRIAARAARGYVAGPALADARRTADPLLARGYRVTLGYWDAPGEDPREVLAHHHAAVADMAASGGDYVSVKAPSFDYDRTATAGLIAEGGTHGVGINFDSLGHDTAEPMLELIRALPDHGAGIGITVPGRWRRGPGDAADHAGRGVIVRVVKGQWADPGDPERDPHRGFLEVVDALAGTAGPVRVATHDAALLAESLRLLTTAGTPTEVELLFGLPVRHALAVAAASRVPIRVYVPYGHGWLPYALEGLKRNPRLVFRLAGDAVGNRYRRRFRDLR